jgi:hypothetical protein
MNGSIMHSATHRGPVWVSISVLAALVLRRPSPASRHDIGLPGRLLRADFVAKVG